MHSAIRKAFHGSEGESKIQRANGAPRESGQLPVLGFDAWTRGAIHYSRLRQPLLQRGLALTLVHQGSWGEDTGRPAVESIDGLPVRDIAAYNGMGLREIVDYERPAAVIFTSTDSFANRSIIRYCRQRRIPTVHLFHGLQEVLDQDGSPPFRTYFFRRLWALRVQVSKGLRHAWPAYAQALVATRGSRSEWLRFASDLGMRARGTRPPKNAEDSRATKACVFIPSEIPYVSRVYGYDRADIVAVGNPDLTLFGISERMFGSYDANSGRTGDAIMYIDGCLLNYGWTYPSAAAFVQHLRATSEVLRRQGLRLIFKPHPAHASETLASVAACGIEVCSRDEFIPALVRCRAAIVEVSSAAVVPMLLGMPVFLGAYGPLGGQRYGPLLTSYPRAFRVDDIAATSSLLSTHDLSASEKAVHFWINSNAGPMPPGDMPARVAEVVASLARDAAHSGS